MTSGTDFENIAFFLDTVPDRACAPTEGDHVARINDSLAIITRMTDDGVQFVRKDCAIAAESTELLPPKKAARNFR